MKYFFLFIIISAFWACNSKNDNAVSRTKNPNPEKVIQKKLGGKEIVSKLEKLGFFDLTESKDLNRAKNDIAVFYEIDHFEGAMRKETLEYLDNRFHRIDCEELFEIGGLSEYLAQVKPTFKKLELKLKLANEKNEQDQNSWKHTIELNGIEYTAFDGQFTDLDWGIAYVNFIEMLNSELKRQNSNEQFYPINCGNDGMFVLLTPKQLNFVNRNYPIDNEHPTTMSNWKSKNGM